jgi:phosphatidylserine/phosphatidylglycerophosphate/cardiolipin synthase-like enzyme
VFRSTVAVLVLAVALGTALGGPALPGEAAGGSSVAGADGPAVASLAPIEQSTAVDRARIVAVYPNPVTADDRGEFVTLDVPPGANLTAYELADDQATVSLSPRVWNGTNATASTLSTDDPAGGRITFSTDPGLTEWLTDGRVAGLPETMQLANSGERVRLLRDGELVDSLQYESAPEGSVYNATAGWEPLGATDRPVVTAGPGTVEAFVLPDESDRAVEFLDTATDRILLAGYTLTSQRVVESLVMAMERGVAVEVLVDGAPVGGMTGEMATALSELDRAGVTVRVLAGERTRYRYHHPKYAVVDDRALVTTENWKPAGTGGAGSRGWAVITDQQPIVEGLVETYRADMDWVDTIPWSDHDPTLVQEDGSNGNYSQAFEARAVAVERTRLLVTPDNAGREIRELLNTAQKSIDIKQVSIGDQSFPFLQAVLDAAARGVEVRILLSSAWYVEEENRQLAAWLTDQAEAADLPLSVRLADPDGAFEKIHAKGIVVDGEHALVGSINWNDNSVQNNREVALLLDGEPAAGYFRSVFEADWERERGGDGEGRSLPLGMGLAVIAGIVAAILGAKRIRFE